MGITITHIYSSGGMNCEFCGAFIIGHRFGIDDYYDDKLFKTRALECCQNCAAILLGEDPTPYVKKHDNYIKRWNDFKSIPWEKTSNPLLVVKKYENLRVGIMKDKYGRKQYGVLLGAAERWVTRRKERYEDPNNVVIRSFEAAEIIAFMWVDFVYYFNVNPEDSYSVQHFRSLSESLSSGETPKTMSEIGIYL